MLIIGIILLILAFIGAAYILRILFFARKIQKQERYHAEKSLEEWDFWKVEGMNLNFVEQVTKELTKQGFRWIDDYKIKEQDSAFLKLLKHQNANVESYIRYFINDIESTVASLAFYKVYKHKEFSKGIDKISCMHYFLLETALNDEKHIQSGLIYESSVGTDILEELIETPHTEIKFYEEVEEARPMIEEHLQWVKESKETIGVDPVVALQPLDQVIKQWWSRTYEKRDAVYYYSEVEGCYKLKLRYCIMVVMCYPFFKISKYITQ